MFLDYYGFREQPFGVTPDPRHLYLSSTHREALASLICGIRAGRGFLSLIAEPGMGKTTLLLQLMERLRGTARIAFLFQTQCNSLELFRYLMGQLGLDSRGKDLVEMHLELNQILLREMIAGKPFVLIIDEAQNLTDDVLETVRLISNFETAQTKLLQIVLAGQPQLADKLTHPGLVQLQQRLAVVARLKRFDLFETIRYVEDRLGVAGYRGGPLFTPSAYSMMAQRARGIPRKLNMLCFNALSVGCALRIKQIDAEIIQEAADDLDIRGAGHRRQISGKRTVRRAQSHRWHHGPLKIQAGRSSRRLMQAAVFMIALIVTGALTPAGKSDHGVSSLGSLLEINPVDTQAARTPTPVSAVASVLMAIPPENEDFDTTIAWVPPKIIVSRGDTIFQISRRYFGKDDARTVNAIRDLNPELTNPNLLTLGQTLRLPQFLNATKQNNRRAGEVRSIKESR